MTKGTTVKSRRAAWIRWLVAFAGAGAIYFVSDRPIPGGVLPPIPQADKAAHALAYAIFTSLILRALWADETRPVAAGVLVLGAALAAAYGATDEFHQWFVPGRSCDFFDWTADAAGATLAALLWTPLTRRFGWLK
jgi:VanZ family protein